MSRHALTAVVSAVAILGPLGTGTVAAQTSGLAWTNLTPTGSSPAGSRDMGFAYDSQGDRLLYFGTDGTWLMGFGTPASWTKLPISFLSSGDDRVVYDPLHNQMILVNSSMQVATLDMSNPTGWVAVSVGAGPPPRSFFAATFDGLRNRLMVFGGGPYTGLFNDVWALSLNGTPQWTQIVGSGTAPPPRWGPVAIYDSGGDRLIIATGSLNGNYAVSNDVWALSLGQTPAWSQLPASGALPPARMLAGAVYDPSGLGLVVFGGYSGTGAYNDVYELSLQGAPAWSALQPSGTPPPGRWSLGAAYRSASGQAIFFGGAIGGGSTLNDVWALQIGPITAPPVLTAFSPEGGRIGDTVTLTGWALRTATDVSFNGVSAPIVSSTVETIVTQVPFGATTGPVSVTTPYGTASSSDSFFVGETPEIQTLTPTSGKMGTSVAIRGLHFERTNKVAFGNSSNASFSLLSDSLINATVDSSAVTGPVTITTLAATGTSTAIFTVVPPDTAARLFSVGDVPNDEGGFVSVRWTRSDFDVAPRRWITGYRVWRRAAPSGSAEMTARLHPSWVRRSGTEDEVVFWEPLATIPASYLAGYAYTAPTTQDSIAGSNPYTAFFIETLTGDPFVFYESAPDSGYSIDNLSPPVPAPFVATYTAESNDLHWGASRASDLREFRLYRGAAPDFLPGSGNLVAATRDTGYVDLPGSVYYKLIALDVHGNASRVAEVSPQLPVATLASLVSVDARSDRIRLTWYSGGNPSLVATLYRRTLASEWAPVGGITADGSGYFRYEDDKVVSGVRYGYRLGIMDAGTEVFAGEAWATAEQLALKLEGVVPNPSPSERISVQFTLPSADRASLELFDVTGRRLSANDVGSLGPGPHMLDLVGGRRLAPGLYLVRLTQGANAQVRRVAVID